MKLKKSQLTLFYKVLAEGRTDAAKDHTSLADARIRDGLASRQLFDVLKDFEEARKKVYETFCNRKEDGSVEFDKAGNYTFKITGKPSPLDQMAKERDILEAEEVEIKVEKPVQIMKLMENTAYQFKVGETVQLDEIIGLLVKESLPAPKKDADETAN